jgi:hypothetical protein
MDYEARIREMQKQINAAKEERQRIEIDADRINAVLALLAEMHAIEFRGLLYAAMFNPHFGKSDLTPHAPVL